MFKTNPDLEVTVYISPGEYMLDYPHEESTIDFSNIQPGEYYLESTE